MRARTSASGASTRPRSSISEHIAHAEGDTRDHLVELKTTIDDCLQRHAALFERVMTASEEFRQLQVSAFRARLVRDVPDLEDRILLPLLSAPMVTVAGMGNDIAASFAAPSPPPLLDLALLFETVTQPRFRRDPAGAEEELDLVAIERVPPEFDAEDIREAQDWLVRTIAARTRLDMRSAIGFAEDQGMAKSRLRCVLFLMLRSWCYSAAAAGLAVSSAIGLSIWARMASTSTWMRREPRDWPMRRSRTMFSNSASAFVSCTPVV